MSKRALRRHHRSRIQAKTLRIINFHPFVDIDNWNPSVCVQQTLQNPHVYRRVDTFTRCSCSGCGNPRRHRAWAARPQWNGRTRQEHLAELSLREQREEL